ncbi:MAG: ferredoxin [Deltaproteobacteria bacterium]|nr:MAG: ferredoxin [Deltaproteobacteria bacterium]
MRETFRDGSEAVATQPLVLLSGLEALRRAERLICRNAVDADPAVAEGIALAGFRAASLCNGLPRGRLGGITVRGTSCVHHVRGAAGQERGGVFELTASSVQEAVDHCLVAHLLSGRLGRPGLCTLAPSLAGELHLVRLPGPELVTDLFEGEKGTAEADASPERVLDLARDVLRHVGERTGRPWQVVDYRGDEAPEVVLVGSGGEAVRSREATQALSSAGVRAGALSVNLVRPFPETEVRAALAGVRSVFVLDDAEGGGALLAHVRGAVGAGSEIHPLVPAGPARLLEAIAERLPSAHLDASRHAPQTRALSGRLVVAPGGPWGDETACQVAAALGQLGALRVARGSRRHLGATVLAWGGEAIPKPRGDLLLASHPALLGGRGALELLRPGGSVVVLADAGSPEDLVELLAPDARTLLLERDLEVSWVQPPDAFAEQPAEDSDVSSLLLAGAALAILCGSDDAQAGREAAERVAALLDAAGSRESAAWLRDGAARVRLLERSTLAGHVDEVDFRSAIHLPRMPERVEAPEPREPWAERIRRFHRTGQGAFGPVPHLPLQPAALRSLSEALRRTSSHPFVLFDARDAEGPVVARGLRDLLGEAVETSPDGVGADRVLTDNLERLAALAADLLAQRSQPHELDGLLQDAGERLVDELALSQDEEARLVEDLAKLRRALPAGGRALDLRSDTPLRLYLEVLEADRAPRRERFRTELEGLRERLHELLSLDRMRSRTGRSAKALAASLGQSGAEYVDPEALSKTLPASPGTKGMSGVRRRRIKTALAAIEAQLDAWDRLPAVVLVRPPGIHLPVPDAQQREHPDPLAAAVGVFDGLAREMGSVFHAARIARLEAAGAEYRADVHDEFLADPDWERLTADEIFAMPAVAVVTSGRRLRTEDRGSLSELLRASRPIHVIVQDRVGAADEAEDLSRYHIDLGTLAVAHREAFVLGSTLARPEPLTRGLARAVRALRPAVILLSLPTPEPVPWRTLLTEAALQGRARPEFHYDPDAGAGWADRFDLAGNPQPERAWPLHRLAYVEDGEPQELELAFTFADAVALEPAYLRHLRIIPRRAWDEHQRPLADYLERFDPESRDASIPYLWVVDAEGTLQRAVVTRALAMSCADRLRGWRVAQELGGYRGVRTERAMEAESDGAPPEREAPSAAPEPISAEALEQARRQGAQDSMQRLAAVLLSPGGLAEASALPTPAPLEAPAARASVAAAAPAPAAPAVEAEEPEEVLSFDEPYIDTPLCTTCNECTNINSRLFAYNAEKQAYIADPAAGTLEELVKAAELCPARCIHPGKPRSGDATATPELIARAAAFNG